MTNPNDTAYPAAGVQNYEESNQVSGLTKLEWFAGMALSGLIAKQGVMIDSSLKYQCGDIVKISKALIEALNKEGK